MVKPIENVTMGEPYDSHREIDIYGKKTRKRHITVCISVLYIISTTFLRISHFSHFFTIVPRFPFTFIHLLYGKNSIRYMVMTIDSLLTR